WLDSATIIALSCTLLLIDASQAYVAATLSGRSFSWRETLAAKLPYWVVFTVLAPLAFGIARRARRLAHRRPGGTAVDVSLAGVFGPRHFLGRGISWVRRPGAWNRLPLSFGKAVGGLLVVDVLMYAAMAAVAQARDKSDEARERALAASRLEASLTEARLAAL